MFGLFKKSKRIEIRLSADYDMGHYEDWRKTMYTHKRKEDRSVEAFKAYIKEWNNL